MASPEFIEFQRRAAENPPPQNLSLDEQRAMMRETMEKLPLEPGVAAERAEAGGVPGIWLTREGGEADPVIAYFHGGGYRIGSAAAWQAYGSRVAAA